VNINTLLKVMVEKETSDLHLKAGSQPTLRINGELVSVDVPPLSVSEMEDMVATILNEKQVEEFFSKKEIDIAYSAPKLGRFRTNIFFQRGSIAIAMRRVNTDPPTFEALHLPPVFEKISAIKKGFVLITGPTSCGKSTTQAAMIEYLNSHNRCRIITIEDPIEFLYRDNKSMISQREVGIDTKSFIAAMRHVVRQDPDVILIGEMRDPETFSVAMTASETGHLVISTLHTADVTQSLMRIYDFFPPSQHEQIRSLLAMNLKALTCQQLVNRADGKGLVPAVEVMIVTPPIVKLIRENRFEKIPLVIQSGEHDGMQTFNQSLLKLVKSKMITESEALAKSTNPDALKMNIKGIYLDEERKIIDDLT